MTATPTPTELLCAVAEPTRLRLLNCLAAAPLFVSDLQAILELPQPTVSRHLTVLRHAGAVEDVPIGSFVLYRLMRAGLQGRILAPVIESLGLDEVLRMERRRALERSRSRTRTVLETRVPA